MNIFGIPMGNWKNKTFNYPHCAFNHKVRKGQMKDVFIIQEVWQNSFHYLTIKWLDKKLNEQPNVQLWGPYSTEKQLLSAARHGLADIGHRLHREKLNEVYMVSCR